MSQFYTSEDFDAWNKKKQAINALTSRPYYKAREIWYCSIGVNVGYEQNGRHEAYERPVLIIRRFNGRIFWAVPLSTKVKPWDPNYYTFTYEDREYSVILSQLRLLDAKRLIRKLYTLPAASFVKIQTLLVCELKVLE